MQPTISEAHEGVGNEPFRPSMPGEDTGGDGPDFISKEDMEALQAARQGISSVRVGNVNEVQSVNSSAHKEVKKQSKLKKVISLIRRYVGNR
jgi:hypothetical protein